MKKGKNKRLATSAVHNDTARASALMHSRIDDQFIGLTIAFREKMEDSAEVATEVFTSTQTTTQSHDAIVLTRGGAGDNGNRNGTSFCYDESVGKCCQSSAAAWQLLSSTMDPFHHDVAGGAVVGATSGAAGSALTNDSTIATTRSSLLHPPPQQQQGDPSQQAAQSQPPMLLRRHSAYARHKDTALRVATAPKQPIPTTIATTPTPPKPSFRGRSITPVHQKHMRESSIGAQKAAYNTNTHSTHTTSTDTSRSHRSTPIATTTSCSSANSHSNNAFSDSNSNTYSNSSPTNEDRQASHSHTHTSRSSSCTSASSISGRKGSKGRQRPRRQSLDVVRKQLARIHRLQEPTAHSAESELANNCATMADPKDAVGHVILAAATGVEVIALTNHPAESTSDENLAVGANDRDNASPPPSVAMVPPSMDVPHQNSLASNEPDVNVTNDCADATTATTRDHEDEDEDDEDEDDLCFVESWSFSVPDKRHATSDGAAPIDADSTSAVFAPKDDSSTRMKRQNETHMNNDGAVPEEPQCTIIAVTASSASSSSQDLLPEKPALQTNADPMSPISPRQMFAHTSSSAFVPIDPPGKIPDGTEDFLLAAKRAVADAAVAFKCATVADDNGNMLTYTTPPIVPSRCITAHSPQTTKSLDCIMTTGPTIPSHLIVPSSASSAPVLGIDGMLHSRIPTYPPTPERYHRKSNNIHQKSMIIDLTRPSPFAAAAAATTSIFSSDTSTAAIQSAAVPPTLPSRSSILSAGGRLHRSSENSKSSGGSDSGGASSQTSSTVAAKNVTFRHPIHIVVPFSMTSPLHDASNARFLPGDFVDIVSGVHKNQTGHVVKVMTDDLVQVGVILGWTHRLYLSPSMLRKRGAARQA